jgi:Phosphotransferase enzyme family
MEQPKRFDEEVLAGGVANAGAVVRIGDQVARPSNLHTPTVHAFLLALRDAGFDGVQRPFGVDERGRERLEYVEGTVALPPYPAWVQTNAALRSIARLLRGFHDAAASLGAALDGDWSDEMADPDGGPIVCHNDVCLENVVFRDREAVALIDFDFAAPGRPAYDIAQFARMCVPIDDETNARRLGWAVADLPARLRMVADAYVLDQVQRLEVVENIDESMERAGEFVRRRVEAGDPNFVAMWDAMGGQERYDRRRRWYERHRAGFVEAMV